MFHDPGDDTSIRRAVTPALAEALDLLGHPTSAAWERHSIAVWGRVDRLAGVLADAGRRARRGGEVSAPGLSADEQATVDRFEAAEAAPESWRAYTDLTVWDDETGERYFIDGHAPTRRAIAAVNHYVRDCCGRDGRDDQLSDVLVADVGVVHRWLRPDPQCEGDDETAAWCDETHPEAQAVTVVSL